MNKAVFFDRDGVINRRIHGGYVRSWEEFELVEEVAQTVKAVKDMGYLAIVITNQRGVGMGVMSEADLHDIHGKMQDRLHEAEEVRFDDIYYCTDAEDGSFRRKPSPAMLLEAADKWNIDLSQSWIVGDSSSDVEAGKRAGTRTAYLVTEHTTDIPEADKVINHISELHLSITEAVSNEV